MKMTSKMVKRIIFCIVFSFFGQYLTAQTEEELEIEMDNIIEELIISDEENMEEYLSLLGKYQVLFASVRYNNRTYFLGRDLGLDQYSISPQVFYVHSNGIFVGVSGNLYSEFTPKWDMTYLVAGYGKSFGEHNNYRYDLSYSRYFFEDPESNDFSNSFDGSFTVSTKGDAFGVKTSLSYLFGDSQGLQAAVDIYGDVKLAKLGKTGKLSFEPTLSFYAGSEGIDTSRIANFIDEFPIINEVVSAFEEFKVRNTELRLPLNFSFYNFAVETSYNINFPNPLFFERELGNSSYFGIALNYVFDLE